MKLVLCGAVVATQLSHDPTPAPRHLESVLGTVDKQTAPFMPLTLANAREFLGAYDTLGDSLRASFRIRLLLHPVDVRFGVGRGDITVLDRDRGIHDGPAYWNARDAIEKAKRRASRAQTRTSRTAYVSPDDPPGRADAVQAALDCLDFMIGSLSDTSRTILGGLMEGRTQLSIATDVGISPSAVSQQVRNNGLGVAVEVMESLGRQP